MYRLDAEDLDRIGEAYCGELDPYSAENKEFAAKIGEQLQNKEKGILEQLLNGEGPELKEAAKKLIEGPDASEAEQIL